MGGSAGHSNNKSNTIGLEQGLELKEVSADVYESVQPSWRWPGVNTFPGAVLLGLAAAAASRSVPSDAGFVLDSLHADFVTAPRVEQPVVLRVQRSSDSGRFALRAVALEQQGVLMVSATCRFVRPEALDGPSMTHAVTMACPQHEVDEITLDDADLARTPLGPYIRIQRMPLASTSTSTLPVAVQSNAPEDLVCTLVVQIAPSIASDSPAIHALGIVCLSDAHVLSSALAIHDITYGLPAAGDHNRIPSQRYIHGAASLSHTITFHRHSGFRADELCYIEVTCPWAASRRAALNSRIFDQRGNLIATCVQEGYYVLKEEAFRSKM